MRYATTVAVLVALVAGEASVARAQDPVRVLLEPHDFSPNGAWRRRGANVRARRAELLRQRDVRALNAAAAPGPFRGPALVQGVAATAVTGGFYIPVIAIEYRDAGLRFPVSEYQRVLFSPAPLDRPYSLKTYYEELSRGRISLDGLVFRPIRVDSNAAFYTDGCNGITISGLTSCPSRPRNRMGEMLVTVLDSLSTGPGGDTIWSRYDNDGPDGLPNSGDDDGIVDFVTFLQPEVGGECRALQPPPTGIWSHRWSVSIWNGSVPYVTRTPRRNSSGQPIAGQFLRVNDYTIQSQLGGVSACSSTAIMPVGTVAHETGHAFGLPDLYDTQGTTQGVGEWSLMGAGNYARPYSPSSYDAWSMHDLGWITVDTLASSRTITTGPRVFTDTIFYAASHNPIEFVFLESRQAVLSDSAQMNPALGGACAGFCPKDPGLLFWLINQQKTDAGRATNQVNVGFPQGVELMQADGLNHLRTPGSKNRGDRGDAFPGITGNPRIALLTNPSARDHQSQYLGFIIDRIEQLPGGTMRFRFTRREPSVIRVSKTGALVQVNGEAWSEYIEVIPGGEQVSLAVDESQEVDLGRTRLRFLSWSHGGESGQTFTSSPAGPDTLLALFTAEHRVRVATMGPGSVTASVGGDLAAGIYLAEGSAVTLTAVVPAGAVFAGWRGDTASASLSLNLALNRAYDLEARFVATVTVASSDALMELLGSPVLNPAQEGFLDELGNRNGVYDVGDYLALLRRGAQSVPPAIASARRGASGEPKEERP
jgi:M6 family metalloprotease-like protein